MIARAPGSRFFAAAMLWACTAVASAQVATESAIKAAYLFKFAGYVEWPDSAFSSPSSPIVIAVVGSEEVAAELERLLPGRAIDGRKGTVRRVKEGDSLQGAHLVFIGRRETAAKAVMRAAQQAGALTVTETGLDGGAAINFVSSDDRITFEVSLDAAERGGYRISSRMLAVAKRVVQKGAP
jgi:hypothetical protein